MPTASTTRRRRRRRTDGHFAAAKARTELNAAIGYLDRAARRLASEPGHLRQAHTLERLSGELAEVLAKLIAADRRQAKEAP